MPTPKKKPEDLLPVGRKTLYKEEYNEQARKLCLLGATDQDLANFFEVAVSTIQKWKLDEPKFSDSIKQGKEVADANVASRLYERALGYEHKDTDIRVVDKEIITTEITKIYPPDPTAAIFWLKNRKADKWRDKQDLNITGNKITVNIGKKK